MSEGRPLTVLIAALGGEGGGVLTDWLVRAAELAGLAVQSTSIPGVAQRTGATTYYVEIAPAQGGPRPLFALYPSPGGIDLMVASELVEAGRAIENGFVDPERTTLVTATHRVLAIAEKSAMGDGRFDGARVLAAAGVLARRRVLLDAESDPRLRGLPLNAVLLGAIAATGLLPIPERQFRKAIEDGGIAVEANLSAFAAGLGQGESAQPAPPAKESPPPALDDELAARVAGLPGAVREVAALGVARLVDHQDAAYAATYLDRLERLVAAGAGGEVMAEAARQLALWMAFEDVIRVADLKSRPERLARIRAELGAGPDEPLRLTEFMKPGVEEVAALLPPRLGRSLRGFALRRGLTGRLHLPLHLNSTSIFGHLRLRLLARLRPWRRKSLRFAEEQALIEAWLATLARALARNPALALEIALLPRLLKGYGDTHRRGLANYRRVMEDAVAPALDGRADAAFVRRAREAALADPEGDALERAIAAFAPAPLAAE